MSQYQGNFHEIVKALRDAIPSSDMRYKDLNLGIILNHLFIISKNNAAFSDNDEKLLRQLMEEHDPETLAEWEPECSLCFESAEYSDHKIDNEIVCNICWEEEQAEIKVANEPLGEEKYDIDTTIVSGIVCNDCKNELPPMTMAQHLNSEFNTSCPHK